MERRLVSGGHRTDPRVYNPFEKHSPTIPLEVAKLQLGIASKTNADVETFDMPTAYLNAFLHEDKLQVMRIYFRDDLDYQNAMKIPDCKISSGIPMNVMVTDKKRNVVGDMNYYSDTGFDAYFLEEEQMSQILLHTVVLRFSSRSRKGILTSS